MNAGGEFAVDTSELHVNLWELNGNVDSAISSGDSIIITVPDPAGILLLAAGTLPLLLPRRRQKNLVRTPH